MRKCSTCKVKKDWSCFYKSKNPRFNGYVYECKECNNRRNRERYKNPEVKKRVLARSKQQYRDNIEHEHERKRKYYFDRVKKVFDLLGEKCARCGIVDNRLLQIDHIQGGGTKHRLLLGRSGWRFHKEIFESIKDKEGKYQLLCANCNLLEAIEKGYKKSIWS